MIVTDAWVDEAAKAAGRWLDEVSELDRAWMRQWYVRNGRMALLLEQKMRWRETLELLQLPPRSWRARLAKLEPNERRLQMLCCVAYAIRGLRLLQSVSSAGIGGRLSKEFLLRQSAQVSVGLEDTFLQPWPDCWQDPLPPEDDEEDEGEDD